ncbi:hypothetical protein E3N88_42058 [Mikania micrantha]|uniref:Arabidopsis retrotransposon Orf1 C-terminal domain-containing protein n=1 Tax=Mikania micrantha TaxID=192012 RepID=A0A5N6LIT8_9ASTR|nr:hypothetical protein E3N88_42058 [Mikania micrantha]
MAGASTSGSRPKRARRVTVAEAQAQRRQQQQPRERQYHYSAPIVIPPEDAPAPLPQLRRRAEHTFLQFAPGTPEHARMQTLVDLASTQHRSYARDVLQQLGRIDEFDTMMSPQWTSVLRCSWLQYDELTVEFLSTLQYDAGSLTDPGAVSFVLGRHPHTMSVAQFAVAFGLYTQEQVTAPEFESYLRGTARVARPGFAADDDVAAFWREISTQPHTDRKLASQIRDPFLRYLHRILGSTLICRHSGKDKVSAMDLFCLYCLHGRHPANLAALLLTSLARPRRGGSTARLDMGPYIGHLAHVFRVFQTYPVEHVTRGPDTTPYELYDMQTAGMVTFDRPPRWMPILPAPVHASPVPPPSTRRILHVGERPPRDAQGRRPVRRRLTLMYLYQMMDTIDANIRRLGEHMEVELIPRLPDPHLPSDPEDGSDTEPDVGADEDEE